MKIRYAPLAVACALMVATAATTTAKAAPVTFYFGGTFDAVPGSPSLAEGDAFNGSFTFESTDADIFPGTLIEGLYVHSSTAIEATVNGFTLAATNNPGSCFFNALGLRC